MTTTPEIIAAIPKCKRRWRRRALYLLATLVIAVNFIAFMQARAMTHLVASGEKTPSPIKLTPLGKVRILLTGVSVPKPVNRRVPELPFTTHRFYTEDGETLEAWHISAPDPASQAGTIVIFHGYTAAKSAMLMQAQLYHSLGFDVFLVDFRGAGGSSGNICTVGFKESLDVKTSVDYLRNTHLLKEKIILHGDSMGAAAIMRAIAVEHVQPEAVILEQPFNSLYATTKHRFESMGVPSFPLASLLVFWGGVQHGFWAFNLSPLDYAPHVTCRTLYIRGEGDPWITLSESQEVFDAIKGDKSLLTIQTNRHDALWPREKEKWIGGVSEFLSSLSK